MNTTQIIVNNEKVDVPADWDDELISVVYGDDWVWDSPS